MEKDKVEDYQYYLTKEMYFENKKQLKKIDGYK